ncbi:AAA family ATPase [Polyangium aurulentum]|uniref:AAA family ATPase n=1 Tax=Polyangium aurulentum TaxID=2567896 RepID=UPI0010AE90A2|nr:AAA family ATPase [Polyangium aurulentum]UQA55529.1 ATP-binding protein [Polyangium aurulentum]
MERIQLKNVGPIGEADVTLGDLTVLVGPQATGKSVFLQVLKLIVDFPAIQAELRRFNIDWQGDPQSFFELYFGDGMGDLWGTESGLWVDGETRSLPDFARSPRNRSKDEHLFFIPAQRVMSLRDGLTRPFTDYRAGDPFALRAFSEKLHGLVQNEFGKDPGLFPKANRLNASLREPLVEHVFGGFGLNVDAEKFQKRIVLSPPEGGKSLPYLVWSAGQREFVPLLLGLYWLLPPGKVSRRGELEWVVIEELEMGLHPKAISATLALVLELLSRGYRVCLSTHSPHVLDVVWGLQFLKANGGEPGEVLEILGLSVNPSTKKLAKAALDKTFKVHSFRRGAPVEDISGLDPTSESKEEAGWGGLTEFSGRVGDVVAKVARRAENERDA